jgi:hypothetical protein
MVPRRLCVALLMPLLVLSSACSKEKLSELADKAKQTVTEQADKVAQKAGAATDSAIADLGLAGKCELVIDEPVTTSACYVTFIAQAPGRSNVLQLRSYRDPSQESFPSVMFQAQVAAGGLSELVGQAIPGQLFLQKVENGPVWSCNTGTKVELKVVAVDEKLLTAELASGAVRSSQSGMDQPVSGTISAVLQ